MTINDSFYFQAMLKNLHAMDIQSKKAENKKNYNQICDDGYGNENVRNSIFVLVIVFYLYTYIYFIIL